MSQARHIPPEFAEWIIRSLDGTITAEDFTRLDREITTNDAARTYYLEFITTYVGLVDLAGVLPKAAGLEFRLQAVSSDRRKRRIPEAPRVGRQAPADSDLGAQRLTRGASDDEQVRRIERYAKEQLEAFLAQEHRQSALGGPSTRHWDLTGVVARIAGTTRWLAGVSVKTARVAAVFSLVALALVMAGLYVYSHRTVATVVEAQNARWDVEMPADGKLWPRFITLEEGYARITLKAGADVMLQAPTTFEVQTANRMFLESGWITAKVPDQARGFTVKTAGSDVVDFGTEFGFLVGAENSAEVHVFEGQVSLVSEVAVGPKEQHDLTAGQAATVDPAGHVNRGAVKDRPRLFARTMPTGEGFGIPGRRLSLADVIGGGNGLDTGTLGQGLDPATGGITSGRKVPKGLDNGFLQVPTLPFVDGVFVPDSNDGSAIVTSTGIRFVQCPVTCGTRYEAIANGAVFQVGASGELLWGQLAGRTYDTKTHPSIGMHPNCGITFDLDAIRRALPAVQVVRFQARCGVSENVVPFAQRDADPNAIEVTFWVLVDGLPRFAQALRVVPAQIEQIDIPLGAQDRFLTLATTHPGEYRYCWAMFAESALELSIADRATAGNRM